MILDKGNHSVPPPPHGSFLLGPYLHWHLICYRLLEHFPVASETVSKARLLEPGFLNTKQDYELISGREVPGGGGRGRVTWQVRLHAWQAPFRVTLCSCWWPSGRKRGCVCESRHDFSKDQHLYTLESPFIHSATDINQRSGPDSPGLEASRRVAGLCVLSLSEGIQHITQPNCFPSKRNYCPDRGASKVTEWDPSKWGIHLHMSMVVSHFKHQICLSCWSLTPMISWEPFITVLIFEEKRGEIMRNIFKQSDLKIWEVIKGEKVPIEEIRSLSEYLALKPGIQCFHWCLSWDYLNMRVMFDSGLCLITLFGTRLQSHIDNEIYTWKELLGTCFFEPGFRGINCKKCPLGRT